MLGSHKVLGYGTLRPGKLVSDHQDGETEGQRGPCTFPDSFSESVAEQGSGSVPVEMRDI